MRNGLIGLRAILACLFGLMLALPGLAADDLQAIREKGLLVAGVRDGYPPFGAVDPQSGQFYGYEIDLVRAIAQRLGVRVQFVSVSSTNRFRLLDERRVDLVAAATTRTVERQQRYGFSYVYFLSSQRFLVPRGSIRQLADLKGKRVGVVPGTTSDEHLRQFLPEAKPVYFDDPRQSMLALLQGQLDAVTSDTHLLMSQLQKLPNRDDYEVLPIDLASEPYGVVVRKGNPQLLAVVNDTLMQLEQRGEAARLFDQWFGDDTPFRLHRSFMVRPD